MDDVARFERHNLRAEAGQHFSVDGRQYILAGKLDDGAIGVVRKPTDSATQHQVVVKFLAPELRYIEASSLEDIHSRFRREGERGAELNHPNLVKIIAYAENEAGSAFRESNAPHNPFIIMEYVRGPTLESFIKSTAKQSGSHLFINQQSVAIAVGILQALRYLHARSIVHRDVKPANIFISKVVGNHVPLAVQVGDFGVVKWGDFKAAMTTGTLTATGQLGLGTWKYMAPEQALDAKAVEVRSDMWAVGTTLFELFTCQILPSPHHVFRIAQQRQARLGNAVSRIYDLGLGVLPHEYRDLFTCIYDCFLGAPKSRPSSAQMLTKLQRALDDMAPDHTR
ncbi:MAG: serine/threonine-protein kinase [Ktedonobacterales bacterium]|jgi:serine/threonine-protein kinase